MERVRRCEPRSSPGWLGAGCARPTSRAPSGAGRRRARELPVRAGGPPRRRRDRPGAAGRAAARDGEIGSRALERSTPRGDGSGRAGRHVASVAEHLTRVVHRNIEALAGSAPGRRARPVHRPGRGCDHPIHGQHDLRAPARWALRGPIGINTGQVRVRHPPRPFECRRWSPRWRPSSSPPSCRPARTRGADGRADGRARFTDQPIAEHESRPWCGGWRRRRRASGRPGRANPGPGRLKRTWSPRQR